jgi:hypothetical protein
MQKVEGSVLTTTYWTILPFAAGAGPAVKYQLLPEPAPENVPDDAPDYLATDMRNRLLEHEYGFRFLVQRRTNPATMPLDEATRGVARGGGPLCAGRDAGVAAAGHRCLRSGRIWPIAGLQYLPRPARTGACSGVFHRRGAQGGLYGERRNPPRGQRAQPLRDAPRSRIPAPPAPEPDDCVVKAAIYPSIGIARVGNSPEEYFVGPEVPDPAHGIPEQVQDLRNHTAVLTQKKFDHWTVGGETVRVPWRTSTGSMVVTRNAVRNGLGIARMPVFFAARDLADGTLQRVLPRFDVPGFAATALYPRSVVPSLALRTLLNARLGGVLKRRAKSVDQLLTSLRLVHRGGAQPRAVRPPQTRIAPHPLAGW